MRRRASAAIAGSILACTLLAVGAAPAPAQPANPVTDDVFTPVTVSPLAKRTSPALGTDRRYHVQYELVLTNTKLAPATIHSIQVRSARRPSRVLATYTGPQVLAQLRTPLPQPADDAILEPGVQRVFYIELAFRRRSRIPHTVVHRLGVSAADNPGATAPSPLQYTVAPFDIRAGTPSVLGRPLRGKNWVAGNGCCNAKIVHRGSLQSINGSLFDAQRYAIDWMRLDAQGRLVHGDPADVRNYTAYGADVLAVADGRVVQTLNSLPDQPPGTLPDPSTITLQTVDGNHVVLALGHGRYAFYAHLQRGSVTVRPGQRVRRGDVLGKLGNSGNTSAPHLHFHVMDGPSILGSDGLPMVFRRFAFGGQISEEKFDAAPGLDGNWGQGRVARPGPRERQFPLNLNIVDFP